MRGKGVFFLAREGIEIVKAVVHAAVFDGEHFFVERMIPLHYALEYPVSEPLCNSQCLIVARKAKNIDDALQDLVHRVPRHPRLRHDIELILFHIVELRFPAARNEGRAPQKAASSGVLAVREFVRHALCTRRKEVPLFLGKRGMLAHLRNGGEIVPERMPADEPALPAAVPHKRRSDARVFIKPCKQPALFQRREIIALFCKRIEKIVVLDAHGGKIKRL